MESRRPWLQDRSRDCRCGRACRRWRDCKIERIERMTKEQFALMLTALKTATGSTVITPVSAVVLTRSGAVFAGKLATPAADDVFVRVDVTRVDGAHIANLPRAVFIAIEAIDALTPD